LQTYISIGKLNIIIVSLALSSILLIGFLSLMDISVFAAKFTAIMSGSNEVPPVDTSATGYTSFRTVANNTVIKYKVNVTGISNVTGVHIDFGKVGANGDMIVDLLKDSKKNLIKQGMAIRGNITDADLVGPLKGKTFAELISTMKNGDTYVNIDTPTRLNGEIRGQIEPGSRNINTNHTASLNLTDTGNITQSR
jgi:CHRD domain